MPEPTIIFVDSHSGEEFYGIEKSEEQEISDILKTAGYETVACKSIAEISEEVLLKCAAIIGHPDKYDLILIKSFKERSPALKIITVSQEKYHSQNPFFDSEGTCNLTRPWTRQELLNALHFATSI